jgi:hypothetical protein
MTPAEKQQYLDGWKKKTREDVIVSTVNEYQLYQKISWENQTQFEVLRKNHYKDDGCSCALCENKRIRLRTAVMKRELVPSNIIVHHEEECRAEKERRKIVRKKIEEILKKKHNVQPKKIKPQMVLLN